MNEAEIMTPQNERKVEGDQNECLRCFKDRSNLSRSDLFLCWLREGNSSKEVIRASKEDYEQLPPYMKSLASWEVRICFTTLTFVILSILLLCVLYTTGYKIAAYSSWNSVDLLLSKD